MLVSPHFPMHCRFALEALEALATKTTEINTISNNNKRKQCQINCKNCDLTVSKTLPMEDFKKLQSSKQKRLDISLINVIIKSKLMVNNRITMCSDVMGNRNICHRNRAGRIKQKLFYQETSCCTFCVNCRAITKIYLSGNWSFKGLRWRWVALLLFNGGSLLSKYHLVKSNTYVDFNTSIFFLFNLKIKGVSHEWIF